MVKFLALFVVAHLIEILEVLGAALIVAGVAVAWGLAASLITAGVLAITAAVVIERALPEPTE